MIARAFAPLLLLFSLSLRGLVARAEPTPVPCKTVDDCWLDGSGAPIARPKSKRRHKLPNGSCSDTLWLDNHLDCADKVCVVRHVPDRC
jgi:hypothetical protein